MSNDIRKSIDKIRNIKKVTLNESSTNFNGKTIVNVDIQPDYINYITFNINNWVNFINKNSKNNTIIFLYNGSESGVGTIGENEYNEWLLELGVDEKVLDNAMFYDKGYSFFRDCMDSRVDEEDIVELVKLMMNNGIYDGRDINKEMWDEFVKKTHNNKIRKFIKWSVKPTDAVGSVGCKRPLTLGENILTYGFW